MKNTAKLVFFLAGAFLLGAETNASAEPPDIFVKTIEGYDGDTVVNCVKTTQDGGFVATGYTSTGLGGGKYLFLSKFDSQGSSDWIKVYYLSDSEGRCVVETYNGDFVVVGFTEDAETGTDWLVLKYDSTGGLDWDRTWEGSGDEEAHGVIEATDHTLWVTGFTTSYTSGRKEVVLAELDPSGNGLNCARAGQLSRDFSGASLAEVFGVYAGVCVAGTIDAATFQDALLVKFHADPEFWWADRIGDDKSERATSLVRTSDACLALAGPWEWHDGMYPNHGGFLVKTDADAQVDWARSAGGYHGYTRTVQSVVETDDEGLVVTGRYDYQVSSDKILLAKWNLDGDPLWTRGFGELWDPIGYSIVEDVDHSLLVAGTTARGGGGDGLLARSCCTGLTCLDPSDGPNFTSWLPSQSRISDSLILHDEFPVSLVALQRLHRTLPVMNAVCSTTIHTVCPGDPDTIQDAIDAASNGDIIELCDGTFTGVGNRDLDFHGKCLTVRSQSGNRDACIIDCEHAGRGFYFHTDEGCHAIVEAITIRNGAETSGGGIYCYQSSPMIQDCRIEDCDADYGGGICCDDASPMITDCEIEYCDAGPGGGGIDCRWDAAPRIEGCSIGSCGGPGIVAYSASPSIDWCTVFCNDDEGIRLWFSEAEITQCTIAHNAFYGISVMYLGPTVRNSIVWGNDNGSILLHTTEDPPTSIECHCCDVEGGGCPGVNNIDEDPQFCDQRLCGAVDRDYHLQEDSPCAAAQQPTCGLIGALDVGCCSAPGISANWCLADIYPNNGDGVWDVANDGDCMVDMGDLGELLPNYGCGVLDPNEVCTHEMGDIYPENGDGFWEDGVDGDGVVNMSDLGQLLTQYGDDCN